MTFIIQFLDKKNKTICWWH